jgi:hypothetical protein
MDVHSLCYDILKRFYRNYEVVYMVCTTLQNMCAYSMEIRAAMVKSNHFIIPAIVELINDGEASSSKLVAPLLRLLYVLCNSADIISLLSKV